MEQLPALHLEVYKSWAMHEDALLPALSLLPDMSSLASGICEGSKVDEFEVVLRSGVASEKGRRQRMEDRHVVINELSKFLEAANHLADTRPLAFYGVYDGHGGADAASFVQQHMPPQLVQQLRQRPCSPSEALAHTFLRTDAALAESCAGQEDVGTTAIVTLVIGRLLLVANAGDCRAVLCHRGKAVALSRDHTPKCEDEKRRIKAVGGFIEGGYLNGLVSVSRGFGDFHLKCQRGAHGEMGPLTVLPEITEHYLQSGDEFMVLGCDGLWDVMESQAVISLARRVLRACGDPEACARELVKEALRLHSSDNVSVVVISFAPVEPHPQRGASPVIIGRVSVRAG